MSNEFSIRRRQICGSTHQGIRHVAGLAGHAARQSERLSVPFLPLQNGYY